METNQEGLDGETFEKLSRQETEEYLAWLSEQEKEKVESLDYHMRKLEEQFKTIFTLTRT